MQAVSDASIDDLMSVKGIARKSAHAIHAWFAIDANRSLVTELCAIWNLPGTQGNAPKAKGALADTQVKAVKTASSAQSEAAPWSLDLGPVALTAGDSFAITGALDGVRREDLKAWCAV
jgi:NAD-dependent DNA ligase